MDITNVHCIGVDNQGSAVDCRVYPPPLLLYHQRGPTLTLCHLQFANDTNICISSLERILDYQSVTLYPIRFRYVSLDVLSSISHISTSSSLRQTRTCVTSLSRQDNCSLFQVFSSWGAVRKTARERKKVRYPLFPPAVFALLPNWPNAWNGLWELMPILPSLGVYE